MNLSIRTLRECEYTYCTLFGHRISPRYAYMSREDWYKQLKALDDPKLNKVFDRLNKYNKNGLNYKHLSNHLYLKLIEYCITKEYSQQENRK